MKVLQLFICRIRSFRPLIHAHLRNTSQNMSVETSAPYSFATCEDRRGKRDERGGGKDMKGRKREGEKRREVERE